MSKTKVIIGKITSFHGVKGHFKLNLYNIENINLNVYQDKIFILDKKIDIKVKFRKGKSLICESRLFSNKEELEKYIGKELWIEENTLLRESSEEFFHKDIIGCKVLDSNLKILGSVKAVHNFGAGDLLELDSNFKYMIRFYNLNKKEDINIEKKKIFLNSDYQF